MFEQDEYVQLRMSWPQICQMACAAMIRNLTMDEYAEAELRVWLESDGHVAK